MSKLRNLRHLSLAQSFEGCTHYGLDAALVTMTGAMAMAAFPKHIFDQDCIVQASQALRHLPREACGLLSVKPALHAALEALDVSNSCWLTQHALPAIARLTTVTALFADGIPATIPTRCGCRNKQRCS